MTSAFISLVENPPEDIVAERQRLIDRAECIARECKSGPSTFQFPGEVDVVIAGSGFLSLYFIGVYSVLSRLASLRRFSGASSGGQAPMELLLAGEAATIDAYFSHARLAKGQWAIRAMKTADRHWRTLGEKIVHANSNKLKLLDGRVHISVTHLGGWKLFKNKIYSSFSHDVHLAAEIFYATGTFGATCNGRWSCDGGLTNNVPMFHDNAARPQLVIKPTKAGLPLKMVYYFTEQQASRAIQLGQDHARELWTSGTSRKCLHIVSTG